MEQEGIMTLCNCPFCGSDDVEDNYDSGYFWVECHQCGIHGPESFEDYLGALDKWNNRTETVKNV